MGIRHASVEWNGVCLSAKIGFIKDQADRCKCQPDTGSGTGGANVKNQQSRNNMNQASTFIKIAFISWGGPPSKLTRRI